MTTPLCRSMRCAFEASARHLSFTKAGMELRVARPRSAHQVKALEERLGVALFRRLPRGLALTDEGHAPHSGDRRVVRPHAAHLFEQFRAGSLPRRRRRGGRGTFATGWLFPRLPSFHDAHPFVDLRIQTNNNRVDLAARGSTSPSATATAPGAAPMPPACSPRRCRRSARRSSPSASASPATSPARRCCARTGPTSGRAGSPQPASPVRRSRARSSTRRS